MCFTCVETMSQIYAGCKFDYFQIIAKFHGDLTDQPKEALEFLTQHGVLPSEVICPKCQKKCNFRENNHLWYCNGVTCVPKTRRFKKCNYTV